MFLVENVIRSALRKSSEGPLNILVVGKNHEKYISRVCQTPNNFYLWGNDSSWKTEIEQKPENLQIIDQNWPTSYSDLIICNNRLEEYDAAASLAQKFHLPILLIDHCSRASIKPFHFLSDITVDFPQMLHKNPNAVISTSENISLSWPGSKLRLVIPASVDTEKFCISENRLEDPRFGNSLSDKRIVFDNHTEPHVGQTIFGSLQDRVYSVIPTDSDIQDKQSIYQQGDYFINPQNHVTVKMLEAMACGNIPICFAKADLVSFIEDGENGFVVSNISDINPLFEHLDNLPDSQRSRLSQNAREKVIKEQLTTEDFISKWQSVFKYMKSQYYTAEV